MAVFSLKRSSSHLKMDVGRPYCLLKGGGNDSIFSAVWQFQDRMVSSANRLLDVLLQHAPWWFHRRWFSKLRNHRKKIPKTNSSSLNDRSKEKHDHSFIPATTREGWRVWHFMLDQKPVLHPWHIMALTARKPFHVLGAPSCVGNTPENLHGYSKMTVWKRWFLLSMAIFGIYMLNF